MPTLLVVESSPRGERSMSRGLARLFVERWLKNNPQGHVIHRDLMKSDLTFTNMPWLGAYFTPAAQQTPAMRQLLSLSNELVDELLAADHIVIGTPVYNYNVPAVLKAYIDHIVRKGRTLGFAGEGLVHGKKCTILIASGGVYTEGSPIRDRDIAARYLRLILKVIGSRTLQSLPAATRNPSTWAKSPATRFCKRSPRMWLRLRPDGHAKEAGSEAGGRIIRLKPIVGTSPVRAGLTKMGQVKLSYGTERGRTERGQVSVVRDQRRLWSPKPRAGGS